MNGLYEITAGSPGVDGGHVFTATLDPDHPVFRGHFPGAPILPGVCSMMIVRECASRVAGVALRFSAVKESKFLAMITPEAGLTVKLRLTGEYNLDATISAGDTVMLKLKATLKVDE